ncbi:MAG: hypothetical protein KAR44_04070 [Candidatus Aegiribacteria sp.]|nr:hypothetical protein [Candidatus Aegiribacteria sp.]
MNNDKSTAISRTQAFWEKKRGYILTEEEARRVNESVTEYFRILKRLAIRFDKQLDGSEYPYYTDNPIGGFDFLTFAIIWIIVVFFKCCPDEG